MSWTYDPVKSRNTLLAELLRGYLSLPARRTVCRRRTLKPMTSQNKLRQQLTAAISAAVHDTGQEASAERRYQSASWLVDTLAEAIAAAGKLRAAAAVALRDEENLSLSQLGERLGLSKARAADIVRDYAKTAGAAAAQLAPIVAVIVTSPDGVLAVRRKDGSPPWTFPGGEIEPRETPAAAAVREAREETGLDITPGRILGRRTHPETGRHITYVTAQPAPKAYLRDLSASDPDIAEARWLSRHQFDELMPGTYQPVLAYLNRDHRRHHKD